MDTIDTNTETFEEALRDAVSQRDHFEQTRKMILVLEGLSPDNIQGAVATVENYTDRLLRHQGFYVFVRYWAKIDPRGALDYSVARFADRKRAYHVSGAPQSWAIYDPQSAIKWAEQNALGKFGGSAF